MGVYSLANYIATCMKRLIQFSFFCVFFVSKVNLLDFYFAIFFFFSGNSWKKYVYIKTSLFYSVAVTSVEARCIVIFICSFPRKLR